MTLLPYKELCCFDGSIPEESSSIVVLYQKKEENYTIMHDFPASVQDSLVKFLKASKAPEKTGSTRVYATKEEDKLEYCFIALSCIQDLTVEDALRGSANGLKALQNLCVKNMIFSVNHMPEQMAIGGYLAGFNYDLLLKKRKDKFTINPSSPNELFEIGKVKGCHQNFARFLAETPANLMTPSLFVDYAKDFLTGKNLKIDVYEMDYLKKNNMGLFMSVTEGSIQPPKFLVIRYEGRKDKATDVSLVGKGITFDSGGISIKPATGMSDMKADMMGAATVLAGISLICHFGEEINVTASIPLCENLPSGSASKPGDVRISMNGMSIEIDNTDAEGRLVLGDAMTHAQKDNPRYMIDVATLTGAIVVALGTVYMGLFSNDDEFSNLIQKCGKDIYNEVWKMPLDKKYKRVMESNVADMRNAGDRMGGSCTAAIFLNEFVNEGVKWAHLDVAGVMNKSYDKDLYSTFMSGKPACLLYEVVSRLKNEIKK